MLEVICALQAVQLLIAAATLYAVLRMRRRADLDPNFLPTQPATELRVVERRDAA